MINDVTNKVKLLPITEAISTLRNHTQKDDLKAWSIIFTVLSFYCVSTYLAITIEFLPANLFFSWLVGAAIGEFFIIGHDAGHRAYFNSKILNELIGRFCFLFTIHSFSLWQFSHNQFHHGYTNIVGKDYMYPPLSNSDFADLPYLKKCIARFLRTPYGIGIYYFLISIEHHILPTHHNARSKWFKYLPDTILLIFWVTFWICTLIYIGSVLAPSKSSYEVIAFSFLIPYIYLNYVIGFASFINHTNPNIPWHLGESKRLVTPTDQLEYSTRSSLPEPLSIMFLNILEHNAHHANVSIPLYNLKKAQRSLENITGDKILVIKNSFTHYWDVCHRCKLYDFDRNCWTDFDGNPTAPPIPRLGDDKMVEQLTEQNG
jgi:acyl-lipid omega-6 desaturase (Delta-12 desaturase)